MSTKKIEYRPDTVQELILMRMALETMREHVTEQLNGMVDEINRLLPPQDHKRYKEFRRYTAEDWGKYIKQ